MTLEEIMIQTRQKSVIKSIQSGVVTPTAVTAVISHEAVNPAKSFILLNGVYSTSGTGTSVVASGLPYLFSRTNTSFDINQSGGRAGGYQPISWILIEFN